MTLSCGHSHLYLPEELGMVERNCQVHSTIKHFDMYLCVLSPEAFVYKFKKLSCSQKLLRIYTHIMRIIFHKFEQCRLIVTEGDWYSVKFCLVDPV